MGLRVERRARTAKPQVCQEPSARSRTSLGGSVEVGPVDMGTKVRSLRQKRHSDVSRRRRTLSDCRSAPAVRSGRAGRARCQQPCGLARRSFSVGAPPARAGVHHASSGCGCRTPPDAGRLCVGQLAPRTCRPGARPGGPRAAVLAQDRIVALTRRGLGGEGLARSSGGASGAGISGCRPSGRPRVSAVSPAREGVLGDDADERALERTDAGRQWGDLVRAPRRPRRLELQRGRACGGSRADRARPRRVSSTSPNAKRSPSLVSSSPMSSEADALVITSWLPDSKSALKVWKNSSLVSRLLAINWTSSTSSTLTPRKRRLEGSHLPRCRTREEPW